ncbi:hypothetical protein B296_00035463 [Ensete ventricosum]|uniref:Uncharacterized protein n=1 Tax=Ensete ventricosum TaxID=4639 RepID=A0A426YAZ2_ENSVE|nr:hypothetical protein B296_00035463 [Ensete ventricosum]
MTPLNSSQSLITPPPSDVVRQSTSTPSASVRSMPDPYTLYWDSVDSLRAQLHIVNQRIDDVQKVIRMKDEYGESSLGDSPFILEIQDRPPTPKEDDGKNRASHPSTSQKPTQLNLDRDLPPGLGERTPQGPQPDEDWSEEHDRGHYCRFYRGYDHDTKESYDLKN